MDPHFLAPKGIGGEIVPPADKSLTHRALMLGSIAEGESRIVNPLSTGDCLSTRQCLSSLGVAFEDVRSEGASGVESTGLIVRGVGLRGLKEPGGVLDAGNSGTSMRLLSGILAGLPIFAVLSGDASLNGRPMGRVVEPLRRMGAGIEGRSGGALAPLCFLPGSGRLAAIRHELPVASAQVKSAVILAALRAEGTTRIEERAGGSRDHTERLLEALGASILRNGNVMEVKPVGSIPAFSFTVPGDVSSAAFFLAAAAVSGRSLEVKECGINPTRCGFLDVLRRMGAGIEVHQDGLCLGEPVGSIRLDPADLHGTAVEAREIPDLIDEIPLVAVLAFFSRGRTEVRGASELRHKESDRLLMILRMAESLGGRLEIFDDGFAVDGPQVLRSGTVDPERDHRIAMAAAVAGAGIKGGVKVAGFEAARVSYPDFLEDFRRAGGSVG